MKKMLPGILPTLSLCSVFAADRHVELAKTGELIDKKGDPAFLISTTVDWGTREQYYLYKDHFLNDKRWTMPKGYEWLYGEQTSVSMLERCGFNALNFRNFANISHRTLAPEYASSPEFVGELRFWKFAKLVI